MFKRVLAGKLVKLAKQFPVVSITGPRQSGKTTLARMVFKKHEYVNLEDPNEREFALSDPKGFLRRFESGVILDEIQRAPVLLSCLQVIVDSENVPGRFVVTGSQQFQLMTKVTQTLAGRTAVVNLLPLSFSELTGATHKDPWQIDRVPKKSKVPAIKLQDIIYQGFYPRIHDKKIDAHDWLSAYYRTYVERDVRDLVNIGNLNAFQRFVRLCAGRVGQLLNLASLANDCGISHTTARNWISVLEASFIIHLLSPHHANFSKRIVKSPKIYFHDTGLLCYLLGIRKPDELFHNAMKGGIFESFVISELFKSFTNTGEIPPLYFWRDRTGHEVDVVIDRGDKLIPVEIKSGETIASSFFDNLRYYISLGKPVSDTGVLIYGGQSGEGAYKRENFIVRPWNKIF